METVKIDGIEYEVLRERKLVMASTERYDHISLALKRPNGKRLYTASRFDWLTGSTAGKSSYSKVISLRTNV